MTFIKNLLMSLKTKYFKRLKRDSQTISLQPIGNRDIKSGVKDESSLISGCRTAANITYKQKLENLQWSNVCYSCRQLTFYIFIVIYVIFVYYTLLQLSLIFRDTMEFNMRHEWFKSLIARQYSDHNEKLLPPPSPDYRQCKLLSNDQKFDCYPESGANAKACESRGCCWAAPNEFDAGNVGMYVPYCFFPPNYASYTYVNVTETPFGLVSFLKRRFKSAYLEDVETIKMTVRYETENRLHVKFTDPLHNRYEPKYPEVPVADRAAVNLSYNFLIDSGQTGFKVQRRSDYSVIFDSTALTNMIFSNQFLQMSAKLPSSNIYGIGEHRSSLRLSTNWQKFTLFNHDTVPRENTNLYGSHPFYLLIEPSGNSHGVFLLNTNAMDIILQPTPAITFRTIGGVLDFYFFLGPTPSDVVAQYTELVGRPFMPPFWALGFHLCRFGYKTLNDTKAVMQRNIDAGVPIDTQWNDLDYMDNRNDFTYDKVNFKGLPQFVKDLHAKGMHYIPLIDPGVSAGENPGSYPPFDKGMAMDIFVKNSSGQPFTGKVWNLVSTVWPDFTNPNTVDYWTLMLKSLHDEVEFDGAWIDMNEPSNMISGSFSGCPNSNYENPLYLPGVDGNVLNYKTMCMTAKHYGGLHYDVHNIYGFTEGIVTSFAMAEIRGKRPMVISRSTFSGQGHYTGHWSGDVFSKWYDMKYTIPQLLSFSIFGIPLMGADICGFNGNTTASLCNRWMQLGAFYPFSRNHNTDDGIDQDPAALGEQVVASSKKALAVRYSLLPYLYTLFWKAHVNGTTVARPLFFEYPKVTETYDIDEQFLWGPAVMILPVLQENALTVQSYIPAGFWYDFYTKSVLVSEGQAYNLSAPLDTIPVLIRGGYILPMQNASMTTMETRKSKIELLVATDDAGEAVGELYWDDGDSLNSYEEQQYSYLEFWLQSGTLRSNIISWESETPPNLGTVTVLGVSVPISEVKVNEISQAFKYDTVFKYLIIDDLDVNLKQPFVITWK